MSTEEEIEMELSDCEDGYTSLKPRDREFIIITRDYWDRNIKLKPMQKVVLDRIYGELR